MFACDNMSNYSNESDSESANDSGTDVPSTEQFIKSLGSWSHFRCPELIVPEAFNVGPRRVLNQIAAATNVPVEMVLATFRDELTKRIGSWTTALHQETFKSTPNIPMSALTST